MKMEYVDPVLEREDFALDNQVRGFVHRVIGVDSLEPQVDLNEELVVPIDKKILTISLANHPVLGRLSLLGDTLDYVGAELPLASEESVKIFAAIDWDDDPKLYRATAGLRVITKLKYGEHRADELITESVDIQSTRNQLRPTVAFIAVKQTLGDHDRPSVLRGPTECPDNIRAPVESYLGFLKGLYMRSKRIES